ncbi:bifunctional 2-polyprenyl-6-hydroxyphenol methylase/3-demethylubiquinol 3-O-methyltransferase UbiG [uncultured Roseobacter sp.]|uniref:class I SAM-dependent methyltransferase n=1 Tax=uncultured Roseobacter sp. TaxID=114847 RepID=UPI0026278389|nr:class I SAM-dependent methyltransferase [uncultured Roseobacter sp.]
MDQLYENRALVEVYDALNASRDDFDFYLSQFPSQPCTVLDIGCGTGTFALELSKRGYSVTAVDPAPQMIAAARAKDAAQHVRWVTGYVSDLAPEPRFDVGIMTGHAFQCLLEDDEIISLFQAVAAHLNAGASFWFETRNPAAQAWTRWTPKNTRPPIALGGGRSLQVVQEVLNVDGEYVSFKETYELSDQDDPLSSLSTLRFLTLDRIEDLGRAGGLRIGSVCGDWTGAAFQANSPEIILRMDKDE